MIKWNGTKARQIARTLGMRVAAKYLRNRGMSFEGALWLLLGASPREFAS